MAVRYALLLLSCVTALVYFQWRLGVLNPGCLAYAWIVFAAELAGFARTLLFLLSSVRLPLHERPPVPRDDLTVDVFVTTCDEPFDVVRRTLAAAAAIRYPHETWLLDDGARPALRELAVRTGCRYVARTEHGDAKAGNLNHALALAGGEFVAVFDADHVADARFLDRTLGYFRDDRRLAFVQTPHEFFNTDSFEHLSPKNASNGASFFHRVVQRSRDSANATIFCGSSAVFRRAALDDVSGFATETISEDVYTSFRLHAAGWHSLFHPEILSAGMAPLDAAGYFGQRVRWAQDALQLLLRRNLLAHPGLTARQRRSYLIHVASNIEGWRHLFIYTLPIAILVTGVVPLRATAATFLAYFAPYFLITAFACSEFSRGLGRLGQSAVYNMARAPAAILATFTAHRERRFRVTPKVRGGRGAPAQRAFTLAVLLGSLGAIAFAGAQALAGRSSLPAGTLAVVAVWAAYHAAIATRLLLLERRCASDRRTATRFAEHFPATLERNHVEVVAASADGFTLRALEGAAPPAAGDYEGIADIAGASFRFRLALRAGGLGGAVSWPDAATRAAFDSLLHERAVARLAAADRGDRDGVLHRVALSRPRYPTPRRDPAS